MRISITEWLGMAALTLVAVGCGGGGGANIPNPGGPAGTTVTVSFKGAAPVAAAEMIGNGNWTTATVANNTLSVTLPSSTSSYAIAYVCPTFQGEGPVNEEFVIEATPADGTAYSLQCLQIPTASSTLSGSVNASAIAGTANINVDSDYYFGAEVTGSTGSFNLSLPAGSSDIAFLALSSSNDLLGVKILRDQTAPGDIGAVTLAASDAVSSQPITVNDTPSGWSSPATEAYYVTAGGSEFTLYGAGAQYDEVPASEAATGDYYIVSATTGNAAATLGVTQRTSTASPVTLSFPAPWAYAGPTAAAFPVFTFNYTGLSSAALSSDVAFLSWQVSGIDYEITVTATPSYQGTSTTIATPDLTALSGFFATPPSGTSVIWQGFVYGGTYAWFDPAPAATATLQYALNQGTFSEP